MSNNNHIVDSNKNRSLRMLFLVSFDKIHTLKTFSWLNWNYHSKANFSVRM